MGEARSSPTCEPAPCPSTNPRKHTTVLLQNINTHHNGWGESPWPHHQLICRNPIPHQRQLSLSRNLCIAVIPRRECRIRCPTADSHPPVARLKASFGTRENQSQRLSGIVWQRSRKTSAKTALPINICFLLRSSCTPKDISSFTPRRPWLSSSARP